MLAVVAGCVIFGIAALLLAPSVSLTSLKFRLDFSGAEKGQYPNGSKFSSSEIISTPVMVRTFKQNGLDRFTTFGKFVGSIYVVESNEAREALTREYQARLGEPRLTSLDRERIQREFELKDRSINKNQFSINYSRGRRDRVPRVLAEKVVHDILRNWADYATNEQHVIEYGVAVLSADVVAPLTMDTRNPIVTTMIMRGNVVRLIENTKQIRRLSNAELMRTPDGLSLLDVSVHLEDVLRYRLDPLLDRIAAARLDDRPETIRFLSTQLSYEQRTLALRRDVAETAQRTLNLYMSAQPQPSGAIASTRAPEGLGKSGENETVVVSDTFIDRLIQLTSRSADTEYRQRLASDYQVSAMAVGPAEAAVTYAQTVLDRVRNTSGPVISVKTEEIEAEIVTTRAEVRRLANKANELHKIVSQSLNPSTELLSVSTPQTYVDRGISLKTIVLTSFLFTLMALVASLLLSFFHSRVREGDIEAREAMPAEGGE